MDASPRSSVPIYVVSALLGVALLTGAILLMILILRPAQQMTVAVGGQQATTCPAGSGAPACFRYTVTNTGDRDGIATCAVSPAAETVASFINGSRTAQMPLSAGEVQEIYVKVSPSGGGDTVLAPTVVCQPT
jgi:hypothetical protein